jgi:prepilin-type N-terminal cleavage/methylation domain-containing protein
MRIRRRPHARTGFTLVELLVVLAIIVLLMSMLLAGINKVWSYADEVKVTNEVNQLAQACEAFKAHFGRYPPSRIVLANRVAYNNLGGAANNADAQLQRESVEYLQAIFPGINPNSGLHNWTGIVNNPPQGLAYLEGQEALIFFLGGMRYAQTQANNQPYSGFTGFCTDNTQPTLNNLNVAGAQRTRPFFEFDMSRILDRKSGASFAVTNPNFNPIPGPGSGGWFPVYLDPYRTPYAYFAARAQSSNNYATLVNIQLWGYTTTPQRLLDCFYLVTAAQYQKVVGSNNQGARFPYWQNRVGNVATYHRVNSFQIVSAGKDRSFGDNNLNDLFGNQWVPNSSNPNLTPDATDNITNFSGGVLVPK